MEEEHYDTPWEFKNRAITKVLTQGSCTTHETTNNRSPIEIRPVVACDHAYGTPRKSVHSVHVDGLSRQQNNAKMNFRNKNFEISERKSSEVMLENYFPGMNRLSNYGVQKQTSQGYTHDCPTFASIHTSNSPAANIRYDNNEMSSVLSPPNKSGRKRHNVGRDNECIHNDKPSTSSSIREFNHETTKPNISRRENTPVNDTYPLVNITPHEFCIETGNRHEQLNCFNVEKCANNAKFIPKPCNDCDCHYLRKECTKNIRRQSCFSSDNAENGVENCINASNSLSSFEKSYLNHSRHSSVDEFIHDGMNRHDAERILKPLDVGDFLLRRRNEGNLALSLRSIDEVMHIKLEMRAGMWVLGEGPHFPTITAMLKAYKKTELPVRSAKHVKLRSAVTLSDLAVRSSDKN